MRKVITFCLAVLLILSLTACGGTGAVSSDVSNVSDVFVGDTVTTDVPPATTTTTAPPTTTTTAPLTAEQKQELQIKQDFLAMQQAKGYYKNDTVDDVVINKRYGTWNGAIVLEIDIAGYGTHDSNIRGVDIAGYIVTAISNDLYLYKNGEFLWIGAAYERGWVSREDVGDILRQVLPNFDMQMELAEMYRQTVAFLKAQYPNGSDLFGDVQSLTATDVELLGEKAYDDFVLYYLNIASTPSFIGDERIIRIQLAGYTFTIETATWSELFIYKDGQVKHLPQAYEAGWLDKETLYEVLSEGWIEFE